MNGRWGCLSVKVSRAHKLPSSHLSDKGTRRRRLLKRHVRFTKELKQSNNVPDLSSLGKKTLLSPHFPTFVAAAAVLRQNFRMGCLRPRRTLLRGSKVCSSASVLKVPELRSTTTTVMMLEPTTQNESKRSPRHLTIRLFFFASLSFLAFIPSIRIVSIRHGAANFPHRAFLPSEESPEFGGICGKRYLSLPPRKFAPYIWKLGK